jgi:2-octaprenyl-6-methoxyphenol hydroxylase
LAATALTSKQMTKDIELLIAGGGLNGLVLGIACSGAGLPCAVVDRQDLNAMLEAAFDGRSSALAYGSQQILEALGLWTSIAAQAQPILEIRVADDNAPLFLHYDHRELGTDAPLGWIIENRVLRCALIEHARSLPNLRLLAPLEVEGVEASQAGATATLSDGQRLTVRLVAAADGAHSRLRRAAGIPTLEWRYRQTAIVTTVRHQRPHAGIAVEHFLPAGPFAILPMTGSRSSIVWTEHEPLAKRIMALSEEDFVAELSARFGDFLGAVEQIAPRWSYPVGLMLAERYVDRRLALVGEAAHVVHPIAGQGLNLGMRDVAALAELIIDARRLGLDIGDEELLRRYQQWRRVDAILLATVTDSLNRLFSNSIEPLRIIRDLGLAAVNRFPLLKRFLMRDAMGVTGDLPRLVQGLPL